jgi:hypothetical protein
MIAVHEVGEVAANPHEDQEEGHHDVASMAVKRIEHVGGGSFQDIYTHLKELR